MQILYLLLEQESIHMLYLMDHLVLTLVGRQTGLLLHNGIFWDMKGFWMEMKMAVR